MNEAKTVVVRWCFQGGNRRIRFTFDPEKDDNLFALKSLLVQCCPGQNLNISYADPDDGEELLIDMEAALAEAINCCGSVLRLNVEALPGEFNAQSPSSDSQTPFNQRLHQASLCASSPASASPSQQQRPASIEHSRPAPADTPPSASFPPPPLISAGGLCFSFNGNAPQDDRKPDVSDFGFVRATHSLNIDHLASLDSSAGDAPSLDFSSANAITVEQPKMPRLHRNMLHSRTVTPSAKRVFPVITCKECGKKMRVTHKMDHIMDKHLPLNVFRCSLCAFTANKKDKIRTHIHKTHKLEGASVAIVDDRKLHADKIAVWQNRCFDQIRKQRIKLRKNESNETASTSHLNIDNA